MKIDRASQIFKTYTPPDPTAGDDFDVRSPQDKIWRVVSCRFTMSTGVAVANRYVGAGGARGGAEYLLSLANVPQGASVNWIYTLSTAQTAQVDLSASNLILLPLSIDMWVTPDASIQTVSLNNQTGDAVSDMTLAVLEYDIIRPDRGPAKPIP